MINGYQTFRGLIVNKLLEVYVGAVGISAFAAANNLLALFWAVPVGMQAVSRMLMSVAIGEEDRRSLTEVMRVAVRKYIPLMCAISAVVILLAHPLTHIFYKDPSDPVFMMTVWGFRILPLCMPLGIMCMHYVSYAQATDRQRFVHVLTVFDGMISVSLFTAILIPLIGMNSVYIANVINGIVSILIIIIYSAKMTGRFPHTMDELMVIPKDFGAEESERLDISISTIEEVVSLSSRVQEFCASKGIDHRRSMLSGLAIEEMAGNIVQHGYSEDHKKHNIEVRVVHKDGSLILRIKDDCVPFNPAERRDIVDPEDITQNIGIRMVYSMAESVQYQNILGLNVLTIRMPAQAHKEGKLHYNKSGR
jgi:anti-sigma regulatory factor (Ser/Thr protein kinase)